MNQRKIRKRFQNGFKIHTKHQGDQIKGVQAYMITKNTCKFLICEKNLSLCFLTRLPITFLTIRKMSHNIESTEYTHQEQKTIEARVTDLLPNGNFGDGYSDGFLYLREIFYRT